MFKEKKPANNCKVAKFSAILPSVSGLNGVVWAVEAVVVEVVISSAIQSSACQ